MSLMKSHWKERKAAYESMQSSEIDPKFFSDSNALCLTTLLSKIDDVYLSKNAKQLCSPLMRQSLKRLEIDPLLCKLMNLYSLGIWEELVKIQNEKNLKLLTKNLTLIITASENSNTMYSALTSEHLSTFNELLTHANQQIRQLAVPLFAYAALYHKISKFLKCSDSVKSSVLEKTKSLKIAASPDSANEVEPDIPGPVISEDAIISKSNDPFEKVKASFNSLTTNTYDVQVPSDLTASKWKIKFDALNDFITKFPSDVDYFNVFIKSRVANLNLNFSSRINDIFEPLLLCYKDKNVVVSSSSAQALYNYFTLSLNISQARISLPTVLAQLTNKKPIHFDLAVLVACLYPDQLHEQLVNYLQHKTPLFQIQATNLIIQIIKLLPLQASLYMPLLVANTSAANATVRSTTCQCIAIFMNINVIKINVAPLIQQNIEAVKVDEIWYAEILKSQREKEEVKQPKKKVLTKKTLIKQKPVKPTSKQVATLPKIQTKKEVIKPKKAQSQISSPAPPKVPSTRLKTPTKRTLEQSTPTKEPLSNKRDKLDLKAPFEELDLTYLINHYLNHPDQFDEFLNICIANNHRFTDEMAQQFILVLLKTQHFKLLYKCYPYSQLYSFLDQQPNKSALLLNELEYIQQHFPLEQISSKYKNISIRNNSSHLNNYIQQLQELDATKSYYTIKDMMGRCNKGIGLLKGILMNYQKFHSSTDPVNVRCLNEIGLLLQQWVMPSGSEGDAVFSQLLTTLKQIKNTKVQSLINMVIVKWIMNLSKVDAYRMLFNVFKMNIHSNEVIFGLISKCLLKIQKQQKPMDDVDGILLEIVEFLKVLETNEMDYKNNAKSEIPLRTIKTILSWMAEQVDISLNVAHLAENKQKHIIEQYLDKLNPSPVEQVGIYQILTDLSLRSDYKEQIMGVKEKYQLTNNRLREIIMDVDMDDYKRGVLLGLLEEEMMIPSFALRDTDGFENRLNALQGKLKELKEVPMIEKKESTLGELSERLHQLTNNQ